MSVTDPIADMLTRLRNARMRGLTAVEIPHSKLKSDIARVLKREGYIADCAVVKEGKKTRIKVDLKSGVEGGGMIGLRRVSTPGVRRYVRAREVPRVLGGMGICILSTSSGVMTGREARKKNVGGELLCQVW
ncbi:MAG: 30S ribosomal protein S8 [Verrucomicrobiae bacterium]|nr:30S ribosomal protein S8 [Verrucomicrobiae bacterium]